MKNIVKFIIVAMLLFSVNYCFGQTRNLSNFHSVHTSSSVEVLLIKGTIEKAEVEMIKGDEKNLITEVEGGVLYVKVKQNKYQGNNNTSAKVKVYYKTLDAVSASAGSTLKSEETISAGTFQVAASSGSTVSLQIEASEIEAESSSGSTLKLTGTAKRGIFSASSGSTLNAKKMQNDMVEAKASSGSSLSVFANKSIVAEASSGSSINYRGDAGQTNLNADRSASISKK